ncbi:MAG TPA: AraC family transcriptional regulator, partial [Clostridiales bacterium]|nr:AraC family transcriptional regulator [Clostridiales bacterium]
DRYINSYFTEAVTFQVENNTIISIINVEDNMVAVMNKIRLIADKLGTEKDYVYFTVIVSQIYNEISRLNQAYKKVGELEKYRTLSEKTQIIVEGDTKVNDTLYFTKMQKEQIENLFLKNKYEECIEHIISILMYNAEQGVSSFSMFLLSTEIFNSCNDVLIKLFNKIPSDFNIKKMYSMLKEYETIEEYKKIWKNFIKEYSGYIYANKGEDDEIIYSVKQYIKENYTSDISVDIIAEKLKMSRSYLSRYFKEKTNECLSDYINRYRIQIASELLKTSSLPINDVYLSVGINNNVTFNRLFKKYTGMTPNTYRRINNFKEEQGLNSL